MTDTAVDTSDIVVMIGVGTGGTGQFLGRISKGRYAVIDYHNGQRIDLVLPSSFAAVLTEELRKDAADV